MPTSTTELATKLTANTPSTPFETSTPYLSIVMPAFNDADALGTFLPQVIDFCQGLQRPCEVVVVDDGSKDDLQALVVDYIEASYRANFDVDIQLIKLSRNFGKEPALSAGLAHAKGDYVVLMDSDGQHPLAVVEQMLEMVSNQPSVDMVAAIQANRPDESKLARTLKSGFYHFIQDSRRYEIKPNAGDFRLMNRKVVNALLALPERQRFMKGLYAWVGFNTVYLPFTADARHAGDSKFNYASLFELAMIGITSFSQKPLRWISRMGMLVSVIAICYGLFIVGEKLLLGNSVDGWATVAAGIMFSAGIQLICLGVIGEYIGRLYEEIKQRPLYLVDETINRKNFANHKQAIDAQNLNAQALDPQKNLETQKQVREQIQ